MNDDATKRRSHWNFSGAADAKCSECSLTRNNFVLSWWSASSSSSPLLVLRGHQQRLSEQQIERRHQKTRVHDSGLAQAAPWTQQLGRLELQHKWLELRRKWPEVKKMRVERP
jgi:hypothetical protein